MNSRIPQDFGCFSGSLGLWVSMIDLGFKYPYVYAFIVIFFIIGHVFSRKFYGYYGYIPCCQIVFFSLGWEGPIRLSIHRFW